MNIDERFEKLEKQNKTLAGQIKSLKKMLGGVASLALVILTGGTVIGIGAYTGDISPESITTKKITVKNNGGTARVVLIETGGHLYLKATCGNTRVGLYGSNGEVYTYSSSGTSSTSKLP